MRGTFIALLLALPVLALGQSKQKVTELKDKSIVQALSSVESLTVKDFGKGLARVYIVDNGSGSAHTPGTDESSQDILICVSEYGEHPEPHVFSVGSFIKPKIVNSASKPNSIVVEEGVAAARKTHTITLYENRIAYN